MRYHWLYSGVAAAAAVAAAGATSLTASIVNAAFGMVWTEKTWMWSGNANATALLMVNAAHGDFDAVVAVVLAAAARSGLGSHARDTLTFFCISRDYI